MKTATAGSFPTSRPDVKRLKRVITIFNFRGLAYNLTTAWILDADQDDEDSPERSSRIATMSARYRAFGNSVKGADVG